MLLQVHDELLFEVPRGRRGEGARDAIRERMEGAAELRVPLASRAAPETTGWSASERDSAAVIGRRLAPRHGVPRKQLVHPRGPAGSPTVGGCLARPLNLIRRRGGWTGADPPLRPKPNGAADPDTLHVYGRSANREQRRSARPLPSSSASSAIPEVARAPCVRRGTSAAGASENVTDLKLDDYIRYTRAERAERALTSLNPSVHDFEMMLLAPATAAGRALHADPQLRARRRHLRRDAHPFPPRRGPGARAARLSRPTN
jgi:hypothetical protein